MMRFSAKLLLLACAGTAIAIATSCADLYVTNTKRSAVEQILLNSALQRSVFQLDLKEFEGKTAYMDYSLLKPQTDEELVKALTEIHLAAHGIVVAKDPKDADVVIQPSCGVLATDQKKILIGSPQLPVPIPEFGVSLVIPEIPLFMRYLRSGHVSMNYNILDAKTKKPIRAVVGLDSTCEYINWAILMVPYTSHNTTFRDAHHVDREAYFLSD